MSKIIQKWSLEVVAVPQEENINLPDSTTADENIPIKVKIRIKRGKKNNSFFRERVISELEIEQVNESTEKVRIVHSDQTIVSFNMLPNPEYKSKAHRKSKNKFFHLFKKGKCLGTQREDVDDLPYLIVSTVKSNEVEAKSTESYNKLNMGLLHNKSNTKSLEEVTKPPVIFLGKCKPGGCLDPPFGEDRYQYKPSVKPIKEPDLKSKENYEVAICEKTSEKRAKRSEVTVKLSNYEEINTMSTFLLYKAKSEKSSLDGKYSDSIITYPPDTFSQDMGIAEKNIMTRKSSAVKKRLSSNVTDTYFMPPKTEKSPEKNLNRNKININSPNKDSKEYNRSNDISVTERREADSLVLESSDLYLNKVPRNIVLDIKEIKDPVPSPQIETDKLHVIDNVSKTGTVHSQNENIFLVHQTINQITDETKSQNITAQTEELNESIKCIASTNDLLLNTVKVIPQINDKTSLTDIENTISYEVKDEDTKSKKNSTVQNGEDRALKHISAQEMINDGFSQEYFGSYTPDKLQYPEEQTPIKISSSHTSFIKYPTESKITLTQTMKNGSLELKSTSSYVELNKDFTIMSSINDNDIPETMFKYDKVKKSPIVKTSSEHIRTISKNNIEIFVEKSNSTKSSLSNVLIEEDTKKQEEGVTKVDHTLLQIDDNDDDKHNMNVTDRQNSHLIQQKLQNELTSDSLDKIKGKSKTSSTDYKLEIKSQVDKSQLEDLGETLHHKALLNENSVSEYKNTGHLSDQDYKEILDLQGMDETNEIHKLKDYDHKAVITSKNINGNISETSSDFKNDKTSIYRDISVLPTGSLTDKYLNDENNENRSIVSQHIPLYEQTKIYSADIENGKFFETDNYVAQKDSITNFKNNIETENISLNNIGFENMSEKVVPFGTQDMTLATGIIDHVVSGNESDSDLQNNEKTPSRNNYTNDVVDKMVKNKNVLDENKINFKEISLKKKSISEPVKVSIKSIPTVQFSTIDNKYFNRSYDISKQGLTASTREDVRVSFDDKNFYAAKTPFEKDINKIMIVDLAFQTYVNDNKEKILRTFDNSKEPQRYPNDNISVIKSALELNSNKFSFTINSQTKLSIEIGRDNEIPTEPEEKSLKMREDSASERGNIENTKHIELRDVEKLQRSLAAIYENDLIPVQHLIRSLILEVDKIAKYRSQIKNKSIAAKKLRSVKPTNCSKRCGCIRK